MHPETDPWKNKEEVYSFFHVMVPQMSHLLFPPINIPDCLIHPLYNMVSILSTTCFLGRLQQNDQNSQARDAVSQRPTYFPILFTRQASARMSISLLPEKKRWGQRKLILDLNITMKSWKESECSQHKMLGS